MLGITRGFIKTHKTISVIICVFMVFGFLLGVRLYVNHSASGDEPHYLTISRSLMLDQDLDLKNQYQSRDYYRYYPADIEPHVNQKQLNNNEGHWYSFHGIGLPMLTLPSFIIGDKFGVIIFLILAAVMLLAMSWLWVKRVTDSDFAATGSTLILLSSYFFIGQAGYIYPDLLTSLCFVSALFLFESIKPNAIWKQCLLGLILGIVVFVHFKTLAFVAPFLLILTYVYWRKYKSLPFWVIGVSLCIILGFFLLLHAQFGVWAPNQIYSSNINLTTSPFMTIPFMLFDSLRGLFAFNPALLLVLIGLIPWVKGAPKIAAVTVLTILPSLALLSIFNETHGGHSPTGRYIMTYIPILLPAIGYALLYMKSRGARLMIAVLICATLFISLYAVVTKMPYVGVADRSPLFGYIERKSGVAVDRVLPHFTMSNEPIGKYTEVKSVLLSAICLLLVSYGWLLQKSNDRSARD